MKAIIVRSAVHGTMTVLRVPENNTLAEYLDELETRTFTGEPEAERTLARLSRKLCGCLDCCGLGAVEEVCG